MNGWVGECDEPDMYSFVEEVMDMEGDATKQCLPTIRVWPGNSVTKWVGGPPSNGGTNMSNERDGESVTTLPAVIIKWLRVG